MFKLTLAIPTTVDRRDLFNPLLERITSLAPEWVEVIYCEDNKEMTIGAKRQLLADNAKGEYIVQLDSDDDIPDYFFKEIWKAIESNPDCIGYIEEVRGKKLQYAKHSITCRMWTDNPLQRTPFYKTPIKTELVKKVGFKNIRYGEDKKFSDAILPLLNTEVFIDKVMYIYNQPDSLSPAEHNKRYGIK